MSDTSAEENNSKITRLKMGTIAAPSLSAIEDWYGEWLGHSVVERGKVDSDLASSWGASDMANRPYIVMQPGSGADVYIRAVEIDGVEGYRGLTTFGWSAFEVIVDDVHALNEKLEKSPFRIIGPAKSIGTDYPTIHAMQVVGPAQEVLYLTCETGDRDASLLPDAGAFVGRNFIIVICGPDIWAIHDFYTEKFDIQKGEERKTSVPLITQSLGLPEDHPLFMTFVPFKEPGNFMEIDGFPAPATARPRKQGQLPPGNAITSFSVNSLDDLDVDFISAPVRHESLVYRGARAASFIGPVGEIAELVEEKR